MCEPKGQRRPAGERIHSRLSSEEAGMTELKAEADPAEVGLDPDRLDRLDRHFRRYVDEGRLPGWLLTVSRRGLLAHVSSYGLRDMEAGLPVETDTLWRIYSMTKPISSVAAMILYEEGAFELTDPVSAFIPAFADVRVFTGGSDLRPVTVPAIEPVRIWHLLTHTAGLTYGFLRAHPVDARYREAGFEWGQPRGMDLAGCCDAWAAQPLLFQPGTEWNYSVATDVLGRVVEVASGQALDEFFDARILGPLGMTDTSYFVAEDNAGRLAALYTAIPVPGGRATRLDAMAKVARARPRMLAYMTRNHLPGGADLETFGRPLHAEAPFRGVGFGLGFAVVIDPAAQKTLGSAGEFSWGGAASTAFWVDPAEELTACFFTQLLPSSAHPIRPQLRQLVYQALC